MLDLCPHCDPYPVDRRHQAEQLNRFLEPIKTIASPVKHLFARFPRANQLFHRLLFGSFFRFLLTLKVLREVAALDSDRELYNRSLVVVREARRRGIPIRSIQFLGAHTNFFTIRISGARHIFEGLPHLVVERSLPVDFTDKGTLKQLLSTAGLPHPAGRVFRSPGPALRYVQAELGWPVVVKPVAGSLSRHTVCTIQTDRELIEAIRIAQLISRSFLVEQYIAGSDFRVTLVDGTVVAACRREPPNVVGDGRRTIRALVERKNQDPLRGDVGQRNRTLHKLVISPATIRLLTTQGLTLDSVLPKGRKAYLHTKVILAAGADIHDVTNDIHPDNRIPFERLAEFCQVPVIGIDVIAQNLATPHTKQPFAILEANSLPYIDMHHEPVTGTPRNVAASILDFVTG